MVRKLKLVKLKDSNPHAALRHPARAMPARHAEPRRLTEQQLKNPLLRSAYERLGNMASYRGRYLRRLDGVNGDRRTRIEKFKAIEKSAEQMLVRLDLATGVLGFIDVDNGRYVLNTQRGIAEDCNLSAPVLCRLFQTLDSAGYVYRRIERVRLDEKDDNGLHLVRTRVLIRFTKLFWKDLGLLHVFQRVQNSAKKKREAQLAIIGQRRLDDMQRFSKEQLRREVSRARWIAKESGEPRSWSPISERQPQNAPPRPGGTSGDQVRDKMSQLLAKVSTGLK